MTTELVIITQKHVGTALIKAAKNIYRKLPMPILSMSVNYRSDPTHLVNKLRRLVAKLPKETNLLVLTDLYGSTPSNIASALCEHCGEHQVKMVAGLNLPMLMKILNYPDLSLDDLAAKAVTGGQEGVFSCATCHPPA